MCRSIKTLREPYVEEVTAGDIDAAALQYVRKISGFRAPSRTNTAVFEAAVAAVAAATAALLDQLEVRPASVHTHQNEGTAHPHAVGQPAAG